MTLIQWYYRIDKAMLALIQLALRKAYLRAKLMPYETSFGEPLPLPAKESRAYPELTDRWTGCNVIRVVAAMRYAHDNTSTAIESGLYSCNIYVEAHGKAADVVLRLGGTAPGWIGAGHVGMEYDYNDK
jgi:hypothetical protein